MSKAHSSPHSTWQILTEFNLPGPPGAPQLAGEYVAAAVQPLNLSAADLERLTTTVDEAVQNAVEQGKRHRPNLPVTVRVRVPDRATADPEPAQGWGFFLIEHIVSDTQSSGEARHHSIELFLYLEQSSFDRV